MGWNSKKTYASSVHLVGRMKKLWLIAYSKGPSGILSVTVYIAMRSFSLAAFLLKKLKVFI